MAKMMYQKQRKRPLADEPRSFHILIVSVHRTCLGDIVGHRRRYTKDKGDTSYVEDMFETDQELMVEKELPDFAANNSLLLQFP